MNNNLLTFLHDFVDDAKVINISSLPQSEKDKIPLTWINIFEDKDKAISNTLKLWEKFQFNLELVYEYLVTNLVSIDLAHYNNNYHLVFGLKSSSGDDILYYHSLNPQGISSHDNFKVIPNQLAAFYNVFNGWVDLASDSMGISPVQNIHNLEDYDWEILERIEIDPENLLKNSFAVFSNGMGGYICIDKVMGLYKPLIWWAEEPPTYEIDFWPTIDTWIRLGFDDD